MAHVDFTDVEERSFDLLPRGQYLIEVTGAEERTGETSGVDYLNLELTVLDGEFQGRKLFDSMSYSQNALWKLKGFLRAAGYDEEDLAGDFDVDPAEYVGMEFVVTVTVQRDKREGHEGEEQNRIRTYVTA